MKFDWKIPAGKTLRIYWNIEEKCREYTGKMTQLVVIDLAPNIVSLLYSFFSLEIGNYDASSWFLVFDFSALFKVKAIWKWYILWFDELCINYVYSAIIASIPAYFVSCCLYISGICDHFDTFFEQNPTDTHKANQTIKAILCKAIKIQVKAMEWVWLLWAIKFPSHFLTQWVCYISTVFSNWWRIYIAAYYFHCFCPTLCIWLFLWIISNTYVFLQFKTLIWF